MFCAIKDWRIKDRRPLLCAWLLSGTLEVWSLSFLTDDAIYSTLIE